MLVVSTSTRKDLLTFAMPSLKIWKSRRGQLYFICIWLTPLILIFIFHKRRDCSSLIIVGQFVNRVDPFHSMIYVMPNHRLIVGDLLVKVSSILHIGLSISRENFGHNW